MTKTSRASKSKKITEDPIKSNIFEVQETIEFAQQTINCHKFELANLKKIQAFLEGNIKTSKRC